MGWTADGEWEDDPVSTPTSDASTPEPPAPAPFSLDTLASQSGASVEDSDRARLQEYQSSMARGETTAGQFQSYLNDLEAQYNRRGASTAHRTGDSQDLDRATYYNPLTEKGARSVAPSNGVRDLAYWLRMGVPRSQIEAAGAMPAPGTPGALGQGGVAFYEGQTDPAVLENLRRLGIPYQIIPKSAGAAPGSLLQGWSKDAAGNYTYSGATGADPRGAYKPPPGVQFAGVGSPGKQFSDPITSAIEDYAARRAEERANPTPGSGQAEFEKILREVSALFRQGGFTPAEQQVFQTQALDPIEQMRAARKQQILQQLSQRGIDPNSGVGMSMLADLDRQFDAMRQQTQRSLAAQSAQETTARMQQAIELLSGLAGTENSRLNESYQYRQVPLQLADRAFNQASSLYNQTGNPLQGLQVASALYGADQQRGDALQELLGYLAGLSR
jgi:hypothetical protein